jgi:hypothetical protein
MDRHPFKFIWKLNGRIYTEATDHRNMETYSICKKN